jgi:hypothetical protein
LTPVFDIHQPNDHVDAPTAEPDHHGILGRGISIEFARRYWNSAPETAVSNQERVPRPQVLGRLWKLRPVVVQREVLARIDQFDQPILDLPRYTSVSGAYMAKGFVRRVHAATP